MRPIHLNTALDLNNHNHHHLQFGGILRIQVLTTPLKRYKLQKGESEIQASWIFFYITCSALQCTQC